MLGRPEDVEVLRLLTIEAVRAPDGTPPWRPFLAALAALTRAQAAALRIEAGTALTFATAPDVPLPAPEVLRRLRPDRIYAQDELDSAEPMRVLRVALRGERHAWLAIHHRFAGFRAVDGAQLNRLAPHLDVAVDSWLALGVERAPAAETAALAGALGAGWLWLDSGGRVIDADAHARATLAGAEGLRLTPAGRLESDDTAVALGLRRALDRALTGQSAVATLGPDLALALRPGLTSPAAGVEPALRAALRRAPLAAALDRDTLATMLHTTRSEARLAAQLCDGQSLAEAASHLGWTLETTRSASKRIFSQTGARGQPDLIRRLQTGAGWFTAP